MRVWKSLAKKYMANQRKEQMLKRRLYSVGYNAVADSMVYSASQKNPFPVFSEIFPKRLRIVNQFFTHLLYDPFLQ